MMPFVIFVDRCSRLFFNARAVSDRLLSPQPPKIKHGINRLLVLSIGLVPVTNCQASQPNGVSVVRPEIPGGANPKTGSVAIKVAYDFISNGCENIENAWEAWPDSD
jgi:hypothetical protein